MEQDSIQVLGVLVEKATAKVNDVEKRRYDRKSMLERKLHEKLYEEFGVELEDARREQAKAKKEYQEAVDMVSLERVRLDYPEGTILVRWGTGRNPVDFKPIMIKSNDRVIIQVYRRGDVLPLGIRWGKPNVGEVILREIKKDGTPGKKVELWKTDMKKYWLPEGQEPT